MAETLDAKKKRLERNKRKMMTVKADQIGVCRFVSVTVQDFIADINGKYTRCGSHIENGLQYENILVLPNGSYKFINSSSLRIATVYERTPEWANDYLKNLEMACFLFNKTIKVGRNGGVCYAS